MARMRVVFKSVTEVDIRSIMSVSIYGGVTFKPADTVLEFDKETGETSAKDRSFPYVQVTGGDRDRWVRKLAKADGKNFYYSASRNMWLPVMNVKSSDLLTYAGKPSRTLQEFLGMYKLKVQPSTAKEALNPIFNFYPDKESMWSAATLYVDGDASHLSETNKACSAAGMRLQALRKVSKEPAQKFVLPRDEELLAAWLQQTS